MKETSETLAEKQLVSSPQQCSCTYGTLHPEVSHKKKKDSIVPTANLQLSSKLYMVPKS